MNLIATTQPTEFQRKCRPLDSYEHYKGVEFRNLILYILPVVCLDILPDDQYNNMLMLHVAVLILIDPNLCATQLDVAQNILINFVSSFGQIYGES